MPRHFLGDVTAVGKDHHLLQQSLVIQRHVEPRFLHPRVQLLAVID